MLTYETIGLTSTFDLCFLGRPYILGGCMCVGLIFLYTGLRSKRFSVNFLLRRSVCSLLISRYRLLLISFHLLAIVAGILNYPGTTLVSWGNHNSVILLLAFEGCFMSLLMLGLGGCAFWRRLLTVLLTESACSVSSGLIAGLTLAPFSVAEGWVKIFLFIPHLCKILGFHNYAGFFMYW